MSDRKTKSVKSAPAKRVCFHAEQPPELGRVVLEREIPSDVALVTPLIIRVSEFLYEEEVLATDFKNKFQLCLEEALRNAVIHGNGGNFAKKVRVRIFVTEDRWGVRVEDEGKGFSQEKVTDPLSDQSLWGEGGRGIHLMAHYMDHLDFYSNGRILVMTKFL